jgi:hypothetical protein
VEAEVLDYSWRAGGSGGTKELKAGGQKRGYESTQGRRAEAGVLDYSRRAGGRAGGRGGEGRGLGADRCALGLSGTVPLGHSAEGTAPDRL